jgi:hypothetical protein
LAAARRLAASHGLGNVSVRNAAVAESQASAMSSHRVSSPPQVPAFAKATENFAMTLLWHAARPELSFVAATLDWQRRRPDSFLATALSLAPVHLSAFAMPAEEMSAKVMSAKPVPLMEPTSR